MNIEFIFFFYKMSKCTDEIKNKVFAILSENRINKKIYLFVKRVQVDDENIWKRISKHESTESDKKWIQYNLPLSIQHYIFSKDKIAIEIIQDTIYNEDNISTIRKKICSFMSDTHTRIYYIPEFQEIWSYPSYPIEKDKAIPLGIYYTNLEYIPSVYIHPFIDYDNFIDTDGSHKLDIKEMSSINKILEDCLSSNYPIIHVSFLQDEIDYLKKKGITLTEIFWRGYIQRYWPKATQSKLNNIVSLQSDFIKIEDSLDQYNISQDFLYNYSLPKGSINYCSVNQVNFHVDYDFAEKRDKNIDLLKLFYVLKNYVSEEIPFIKYIDPSWDSPYCIIDKSVMENKIVDKKRIKDWVFGITDDKKILGELKEQIHKAKRGLQIKLLNNELTDKEKENPNLPRKSNWITITINSKGTADIRLSYTQTQQAYFKDIYNVLEQIKNVMLKLNDNDLRLYKTLPKDPLPIPTCYWENNKLILGDNTKFAFINFYIPLELSFPIIFEDLYKMIPLFSNYISRIPKESYTKKVGLFEVRYNRVSNFTNWKDIYTYIQQKKQDGVDEIMIQQLIQESYDKTPAEASNILYEYKKFIRSLLIAKADIKNMSGVTITMRQNVIQLRNCKNEEQLQNVVWFLTNFLGCYLNLGNIEKRLIKEGYSSLAKWESKEIQNDFIPGITRSSSLGSQINENISNEFYIQNENTNLQLGLDLNEYLENMNENEELENSNEKFVQNELMAVKNKFDISVDLASNTDIGKDVQLRCKDAILELDTCADICNDDKYVLRRLQRYDNKLFKFTAKKFVQYARICSKTQEQQPLVLPYDPTTNPKIKPESYTYFVRTGSNPNKQYYYFCPKVWCPFCLIPIFIEDVKNIKSRMTKSGKCQTGICPNGDHQVMIFASQYFEGLSKERYPGFIEPSKHPEGYCLPCCYKKPHNDPQYKDFVLFKRCLGEEVQMTEVDSYYILGREKIPLEENRYGILPFYIGMFFKTTCDTGYLDYGHECFLRHGINQIMKPSFLYALYVAVSTSVNLLAEYKIPFQDFRTYLKNRCTREIFLSLHHGSLFHIFKDPFQKIKDPYEYYLYYLENAPSLDENYLWDFLSRPGILFPQGLNIFIFSKTENDQLVCPIGFNSSTFYEESRPSIFLIHMKSFYEPIAFIKRDMQGKLMNKMIFDRNDHYVSKAIYIMNQNCVPKYDINWLMFLQDSLTTLQNVPKNTEEYLKTISPPKELSYESLLLFKTQFQELFKSKSKNENENENENIFNPEFQVVDTYGKTIGILFQNNKFIPIEPHGMLLNIPIGNYNDISWQNGEKTFEWFLNLYEEIGIKEMKPYAWIQSYTGNKILGLLLLSGRIIPVQPFIENNEKWFKKLQIFRVPFYKNANTKIQNNIENMNERTENISYLQFEEESYERFRLECGTYLQLHEKIKKQILDIIFDPEKNLSEKREVLLPLLESIMASLVVFQRPKDDNFQYSLYKIPNYRTACLTSKKQDCHDNPHCIWSEKEKHGKLYLTSKTFSSGKDTFTFFLYRILDELLRNRLKREEIIQLTISEIIDKTKMEVKEGQLLLTDVQPLKQIMTFYTDIEKFGVEKQVYNTLNPDLNEEQIMKYQLQMKEQWFDIPSEELTSQWVPLLPNFKFFNFSDQCLWQSLTQLGNNSLHKIPYFREILDTMSSSQFSILLWKKWFLEQFINLENVENAFYPIPNIHINKKLEGGNNTEKIIQLAKIIAPEIWKGIDTWEQFLTLYMQPMYEGGEMELAYLGKKLGIQFVIIYKRSPKYIPLGITCLGNVDKLPKYSIFFYSKSNQDIRNYRLIHKEDLFIVPNEMIPGKMYQLILDWYRSQETLLSGMKNTMKTMENEMITYNTNIMPLGYNVFNKKNKKIMKLKKK